jgi:hypothetical protein
MVFLEEKNQYLQSKEATGKVMFLCILICRVSKEERMIMHAELMIERIHRI